MSELSSKIDALRGRKSIGEIIEQAGISRGTFRKIKEGGTVKLSTLRQVADTFKLSEPEWLELLTAWLKTEAGADRNKLWIEVIDRAPSQIRDQENNLTARAAMLFESLNSEQRKHILSAMQRKEVIACIAAINRVWEKFDHP